MIQSCRTSFPFCLVSLISRTRSSSVSDILAAECFITFRSLWATSHSNCELYWGSFRRLRTILSSRFWYFFCLEYFVLRSPELFEYYWAKKRVWLPQFWNHLNICHMWHLNVSFLADLGGGVLQSVDRVFTFWASSIAFCWTISWVSWWLNFRGVNILPRKWTFSSVSSCSH